MERESVRYMDNISALCESFNAKKFLQQSSIEGMSVLFVKQRIGVFEPPFMRLGGNVCSASLAYCKARSRLPICYNRTFLLALTTEALGPKIRRNQQSFKEVGQFEGTY